MPSHDFDLYPSQDTLDYLAASSGSFIPASTIFDPTYTMATTFDTYPPGPAFSTLSRSVDYGVGAPHEVQPSYSPNAAPANTMSQAFDVLHSHLTTTSESGSSLQNTASSLPSPHLHQTFGGSHGVSYPQSAEYPSVTGGFGQERYKPMTLGPADTIPAERTSDFVGEFATVPSSRHHSTSLSLSPKTIKSSTGKRVDSIVGTSPKPFTRWIHTPDTDFSTATFKEPKKVKRQRISLDTSCSAAKPGLSQTSPSKLNALSHFHQQRPSLSVVGSSMPGSQALSSRVGRSIGSPASARSAQALCSSPSNQSFFSQTSGFFVPPLQSSCWFPYPSLCH